jgi:multiple sugar transport system ATP-binding protein
MSLAPISIRKLVKRYKDTEVLHGIDLDIADGEFVVLVGPSGCGKSTTLRMIAGLEDISGGEIAIGDRVVNHIEPKDRNIAMVFQNYAIYPHMSVYKNVSFGLRTSKVSPAEKDKRIREVAAMLDLTELLERKPSQLSGGQRQRVAIGRAMVRDPSVFLFDEPLSNLDAQLRAQTRLEIKKLHQRLRSTIVFVTHDQVEAMTMADRIVIMRDGHIQQIGTPTEVYSRPANTFVARFIGSPSMNMLAGVVASGAVTMDGIGATPPMAGLSDAGRVLLGIRPDDLRVGERRPGAVNLKGTVEVVEPLGPDSLVYLDVAGQQIIAKTDARRPVAVGEAVELVADMSQVHVFDEKSGQALIR